MPDFNRSFLLQVIKKLNRLTTKGSGASSFRGENMSTTTLAAPSFASVRDRISASYVGEGSVEIAASTDSVPEHPPNTPMEFSLVSPLGTVHNSVLLPSSPEAHFLRESANGLLNDGGFQIDTRNGSIYTQSHRYIGISVPDRSGDRSMPTVQDILVVPVPRSRNRRAVTADSLVSGPRRDFSDVRPQTSSERAEREWRSDALVRRRMSAPSHERRPLLWGSEDSKSSGESPSFASTESMGADAVSVDLSVGSERCHRAGKASASPPTPIPASSPSFTTAAPPAVPQTLKKY